MKNLSKVFSWATALILFVITSFSLVTEANAEQIDVSYLQTCLKSEGSSLDVLVLMDSSKSLRDALPEEREKRKFDEGSDSKGMRGPILKSSLKLLRTLAEESKRNFNISLRNFGNNSDPDELAKLKSHWINWTDKTSDGDIDSFIENSLYNDSPGTEWANGLASAKSQFKQRIGEAQVEGGKSCPIMFWITDGAPTDPVAPICSTNSDSSIEWFRQNNILVLGGLLKPRDGVEAENAGQFRPIVVGENCGRNEDSWTRGEVIEAKDISSLAWGFVGLIANIKNLVNLNGDNSGFNVDPSTSHIEIFTRHTRGTWEVKMPNGSKFCSSSNLGGRCKVQGDPITGITTITVYPERPIKAAGTWSITPALSQDDFLAYGGLDTPDPFPNDRSPKLVIDPAENLDAEEGKDTTFQARILNPDGSEFSLDGYKSVTICAKLPSANSNVCVSGKTSASLTVKPNLSDRSIEFEAVLVSARDSSRSYTIPASAKLSVLPNGIFPRLKCSKEPCALANLANKNSKAVSSLEVVATDPGAQIGRIYLMDYRILADDAPDRGDGHFFFQVTRSNGQNINWNDPAQLLAPGEKLTLTVTTDQSGSGDVQGVLRYMVIADGEVIERQVSFSFGVANNANTPLLITLMLLTYLLTVGIPYAYLLYSARKNAHFIVPDNQYAYLEVPVLITSAGKVVSKAEGSESFGTAFTTPSHQNLRNEEIGQNETSLTIGSAHFEVIAPKWNPFADSATTVSIPGHHIMTTFSGTELTPESAYFNQNLVGDAVLYFSSENNLAPVTQTQIQSSGTDSKTSLFEASLSEVESENLVKKTGDIYATALFIVPRYGNRKKSMEDLVAKFRNTVEGANLAEPISELRAKALDETLAEAAALAVKVGETTDKESEKKAMRQKKSAAGEAVAPAPKEAEEPLFGKDKSFDLFGDSNSSSKNLFDDDDGNSGSRSGKSLW